MINSFSETNSSNCQIENSLANISKKKKPTKKIKIKTAKSKISKQILDIKCYKNLCNRNISTSMESDISLNAFITRVKIINAPIKKDKFAFFALCSFPEKPEQYDDIPELQEVYTKLTNIYNLLNITIYNEESYIGPNSLIEETFIIELISIKKELIKICIKYNINISATKEEDKTISYYQVSSILEYVQVQLFNCYHVINDKKNQQLIINQLTEQQSEISFALLGVITISDINTHNDIESLDFQYILTRFNDLEKHKNKIYASLDNKKNNIGANKLTVFAKIFKIIADKTNINPMEYKSDDELCCSFIYLVPLITSCYFNTDNYQENIHNFSLSIDFYFDKLKDQDHLIQAIHALLLKTNSICFLEEFSSLVKQLRYFNDKMKYTSHQTQKYNAVQISNIQQQIKHFFIKYEIPINNLDIWYDQFINEKRFSYIFHVSSDIILDLAKLVDLSIKYEKDQRVIHEIQNDKINNILDIFANDHKKLVNDKIDWQDIPIVILLAFKKLMLAESIKYSFGISGVDKNEDLAVLFAKITQIFAPFLGTALLSLTHNNSYNDLLSDLDMLEFLVQNPTLHEDDKNCRFLMAQIITYLIDKNKALDLSKKQLLFSKAKTLYLELADFGVNKAYLLLAETIDLMAKEQVYKGELLEAAKLYSQAKDYCQILLEAGNIDMEMQDIAITNMDYYNIEIEVLRQIYINQKSLLEKPEASKTTSKKKKQSLKKTDPIAKIIEPQEFANEITPIECANWYQDYKTTDSKLKKTKSDQIKQARSITKKESREEINTKYGFWTATKKLLTPTTDLTLTYKFLLEIINNNYFKNLESNLKNNIMQNDSYMIPLIYQSMAYYYFLQLKNVQEIGSNVNNLKLFTFSTSTTSIDNKVKKVTAEQLFKETEQLIRYVVKLIFPNIIDIETKDLKNIVLSLSPANYSTLKKSYKNRLAAIISTYGHLKSIEDIAEGRRGKFRISANLYAKADEINPDRIKRKQTKKAS